MANPEPELTSWPLDRLRIHRWQSEIYGPRSLEELQQLADMIRVNGMEPIHVAPDGTILDGHQREIVARRFLELTEVPVKIRHDLAAQGSDILDDFFVQTNLSTRSPSKLQLAAAYKRSVVMEKKRMASNPNYRPDGRVRDIVARRFGLKGRTMQDWVCLLDAPLDIQYAVDERRISLAEGLSIARATKEQRDAIMALFNADVGIRSAMRQVFGSATRPPLTPAQLTRRWRDLIRAAIDVNSALPGSLGSILREHRKGLLTLVQLASSVDEHLKTTPVHDMRKKLRGNAQTDDAGPDDGTDSAEQTLPDEPSSEMPTAPLASIPRPTPRSGAIPVKPTPVPLVGPRGAPRPVPQPKPRPRDANAAPDSRTVGRPHPIPQIPKPKPA